jgi:hypothetical protein
MPDTGKPPGTGQPEDDQLAEFKALFAEQRERQSRLRHVQQFLKSPMFLDLREEPIEVSDPPEAIEERKRELDYRIRVLESLVALMSEERAALDRAVSIGMKAATATPDAEGARTAAPDAAAAPAEGTGAKAATGKTAAGKTAAGKTGAGKKTGGAKADTGKTAAAKTPAKKTAAKTPGTGTETGAKTGASAGKGAKKPSARKPAAASRTTGRGKGGGAG